jgi:dihydroxyacetone kinase
MGISLSAGTVPAVGKPSYNLGDLEVELGLGIHGEPGIRRGMLRNADEHADEMVDAILSVQLMRAGDQAAVVVNNLGATTTMELAIVARRAVTVLESRGVVVQRVYAGTFMSSLDAAGVSISLMRVNDERLTLLDAPTSAPAWPNVSTQQRRPIMERTILSLAPDRETASEVNAASEQTRLHRAIEAACESMIAAKDQLTELDRIVGDSDLGTNLARGAEAVREMLRKGASDDAANTLRSIAEVLQRVVGGSSGPFYGVLLLRAANTLRRGDPNDPRLWARACREGDDAVSEIGGAVAGDRTMLDALIPFATVFRSALDAGQPGSKAVAAAASAAEEGAHATAQMLPRRGRSTYLGERCLGHADPGATAVAIWLRAVSNSLAGE